MAGLASPWNWIYKADILAKDQHWYEKNVMARGPSSSWSTYTARTGSARRTRTTGTKGKPTSTATGPSSSRMPRRRSRPSVGERAMIQFRGFSPQQRDSLVAALGNKLTVQESPWNCSIQVALNQQRSPSKTGACDGP